MHMMNKMNEIINSYVQDIIHTVEGAIQWLWLVKEGTIAYDDAAESKNTVINLYEKGCYK